MGFGIRCDAQMDGSLKVCGLCAGCKGIGEGGRSWRWGFSGRGGSSSGVRARSAALYRSCWTNCPGGLVTGGCLGSCCVRMSLNTVEKIRGRIWGGGCGDGGVDWGQGDWGWVSREGGSREMWIFSLRVGWY